MSNTSRLRPCATLRLAYRINTCKDDGLGSPVYQRVAAIEQRIAAHDAAAPTRRDLTPVSLASLAEDLETVWAASTTDAWLKKRIVRTVIHKAIADLDDHMAEIGIVRLFDERMHDAGVADPARPHAAIWTQVSCCQI
ncbi:hypothetical protein [Roseomonas gilardii]|uniref:hypothetical protein n=1 Tax=Roseomonas gilardii TaxID=257708 RepID=UPI0011A6E904|nr:hypothetical protein [Roseomonas gilardii]